MPQTTREVFDWHLREGAFARLSPPWEQVRLLEFEGLRDGQKAVIEVYAPWKRKWVAEHRNYLDGLQFRDVQLEGPMAKWEHTHRVEPDPKTQGRSAIMHDHVTYQMPMGPLGMAAHGLFVRKQLEQMFAYRHAVLEQDLRDHERAKGRSLTVAITGQTGFIGSSLSPMLTTGGHSVRRIRRAESGHGWEMHGLVGADAVVHLAGEPIAQRWSSNVKQRIRDSRVEGTRNLCEALARMPRKPAVLIAASAVGFYGTRGDEVLTESSPAGTGFLADVSREWEAATLPAVAAGIRVVNLRIGIVLSPRGGALQKMLPVFKLGLGGKLAGGRHWWPWVSMNDMVGIVYRCILDDRLVGPVNACAPNPATNAQFTSVLGRVLGRPAVFPVPRVAVHTAFGQMGIEALLNSQRVLPGRLIDAGYAFREPDLEQALRVVLGRRLDV